VQGAVNPDEFYVYKPTCARASRPSCAAQLGSKQIRMVYYSDRCARASACASSRHAGRTASRFSISDADVHELSKQALVIEQHYGRPMDIEWAKDGITGKLYIVQARPETVKSRAHATAD
jgi:pyruvate,water dikinase